MQENIDESELTVRNYGGERWASKQSQQTACGIRNDREHKVRYYVMRGCSTGVSRTLYTTTHLTLPNFKHKVLSVLCPFDKDAQQFVPLLREHGHQPRSQVGTALDVL